MRCQNPIDLTKGSVMNPTSQHSESHAQTLTSSAWCTPFRSHDHDLLVQALATLDEPTLTLHRQGELSVLGFRSGVRDLKNPTAVLTTVQQHLSNRAAAVITETVGVHEGEIVSALDATAFIISPESVSTLALGQRVQEHARLHLRGYEVHLPEQG